MSADLVAYGLLALDLLLVGLVLAAPLLLVLRLSGRRRAPAAEPVLRRCEACRLGWKGRPGDDRSLLGVRLRRWLRRRARRRQRQPPAWTGRQGWDRCPSCLSTKVRTSSRSSSEAPPAPG